MVNKFIRTKITIAVTAANLPSFWTATFSLLCTVQLLGYAQQAMFNPTAPLYITELGLK